MMAQIVWNKSSLLLNIQKQKKQKLQLFTINIKTEIIYKNAKLEGLGAKTKWSNYKREESLVF
jgi:hypothetical protein